MYVPPGSQIKLLRGVQINNSYQDTLWFADATAQYNYFNSKAIVTYTDFSYQRVNKEKIRVPLGAESCYNVNYMMFQNTNFGSKWFYAFVTNVEYINNECTEITYEIDVIQTWWFELTFRESLIIRNHVPTDGLYEHCEDELINCTDYYTNYEDNLFDTAGTGVIYILLTTGHLNGTTWVPSANTGEAYGLYCGLEIALFDSNSTGSLASTLDAIIDAGHEDDIVALFAGPNVGTLVNPDPNQQNYAVANATLRAGAFQGYVPRNNKMYNYPFCKVTLATGGKEQDYAVEDFRIGTSAVTAASVTFDLFSVALPSPSLMVVPRNYKGETLDYNAGIQQNDFPQCAFRGDTYKMWCVQNTGGFIANLVGEVANMGISAVAGTFGSDKKDYVGMAISARGAVEAVSNYIGERLNASTKADTAIGLTESNILSNLHINTIWLKSKTIGYWKARQIDTYLTKFGYYINRVRMPDLHARTRFTYVQTGGCVVVGNVPADDLAFIGSCFDNGITLWADHDGVGDYAPVNAIIT